MGHHVGVPSSNEVLLRDSTGYLYRDHGLVFTSGVGTLINPTNLRLRSFAPLLQRAGLPQVRLHDLRHT
jgi:integrase